MLRLANIHFFQRIFVLKNRNHFILWTTAFVLASCASRANNDNTARVMQETDDRESALTSSLLDSGSDLEEHVNNVLLNSRILFSAKDSEGKKVVVDKAGFLNRVFQHLGAEIDGTGIDLFVAELSKLTAIEVWFDKDMYGAENKVVAIPWEKCRYADNSVSIFSRYPSLKTKSLAQHSMAPVVRIHGVLMGVDKWAHFFNIGYLYFQVPELRASQKERDAMSRWLEGEPEMPEAERSRIKKIAKTMDSRVFFGIYGMVSSGVYSNADMAANEDGFKFFEALNAKPETYKFSLSDYDLKKYNEILNPNRFAPGLLHKDE